MKTSTTSRSSPVLITLWSTPGGHNIEGVGLGFVPELLDNKYYDEARTIDENEAFQDRRLKNLSLGSDFDGFLELRSGFPARSEGLER